MTEGAGTVCDAMRLMFTFSASLQAHVQTGNVRTKDSNPMSTKTKHLDVIQRQSRSHFGVDAAITLWVIIPSHERLADRKKSRLVALENVQFINVQPASWKELRNASQNSRRWFKDSKSDIMRSTDTF